MISVDIARTVRTLPFVDGEGKLRRYWIATVRMPHSSLCACGHAHRERPDLCVEGQCSCGKFRDKMLSFSEGGWSKVAAEERLEEFLERLAREDAL